MKGFPPTGLELVAHLVDEATSEKQSREMSRAEVQSNF